MTKGNIVDEKCLKEEREKMLENIANARLTTINYYLKTLTKEEWEVIDILEKKSQEVRITRSSTWIEISKDILTENLTDALIHYFNYRFKKTRKNKKFVKNKEGMKFFLIQKRYGKLFLDK